MIRVANKRTYKGPGEYIGRPSIFGNPHNAGTREENVAKYKPYFNKRYAEDKAFKAAVHALAAQALVGELILICWCDPLPCHGHIIRDYIQYYNEMKG